MNTAQEAIRSINEARGAVRQAMLAIQRLDNHAARKKDREILLHEIANVRNTLDVWHKHLYYKTP